VLLAVLLVLVLVVPPTAIQPQPSALPRFLFLLKTQNPYEFIRKRCQRELVSRGVAERAMLTKNPSPSTRLNTVPATLVLSSPSLSSSTKKSAIRRALDAGVALDFQAK
jgi:hypothetical protein